MMKKRIISLVAAAGLALSSLTITVSAAKKENILPENTKILMCTGAKTAFAGRTDEELDYPPYMSDNVLMLPAEWFLTNNGYEASEDNTSDSLTFTGEHNITITYNSDSFTLDNTYIKLERAVEKKNDALYISLDICRHLDIEYKMYSNGIFYITENGNYDNINENQLIKLMGVYVSPNGSDSNDGTPQKPFKTLNAAKKLAADYMELYGDKYLVHIYMMAGRYYIDSTVVFEENAFTLDSYKGLKIQDYGDGEVELTGAIEIDAEKLKPVTDPITLARLPKEGRGNVAYLDLTEIGITQLDSPTNIFHYLYLNDIEQTNARWPNEGFATIYSVPEYNSFTFGETNPTRWTAAKNAYICGQFSNWGWVWYRGIITSVDPNTKTIKITTPNNNNGIQATAPGTNYYATNLLEEIDMPGEWYVDCDNLMLYYYPPYSLKDSKLEMMVFTGNMIQLNKCKNITIEGLTFTKGARAIDAQAPKEGDVRGITIRSCRFSHFQDEYTIGLAVNNGQNLYDITIEENEAYNMFGRFVQFRAGNMETLTDGNCVVRNNHVILPAQFYASGGMGAPWNGAMGVTTEHNIVQDCPRGAALGWPGTNSKINYNEIVNSGKYMNDYGAIYMGRTASYFDIEVAYNYIHDNDKDSNYCGLYNDDAICYVNWHHNVCVDINVPAIFAAGIESKYMYNLAVNCKSVVQMSPRLNYNTIRKGEELWTGLNDLVNRTGDLYLKAYPKIPMYLERDPFAEWWDVIVLGNVAVGGKTLSNYNFEDIDTYGAKTMEVDGETIDISALNGKLEGNPEYQYSDDLFVDPENGDYSINPDSQIAKDVPEMLNLDINSSGINVDNPILLQKPEKGSRLRYPRNGQQNLNASGITFSWDPVKGASFYKIIIATDSEMKNVVYETQIRENANFNQITVTNLDNDQFYYWKVQAISVVRQNQFTIDSQGGPYLFKTAKRDALDKENLKLALETLEKFCNEDLKNTEYQYDEEFIKSAETLLSDATQKYRTATTQTVLDETEEEIYNLIKKSPYYMIVKFENIDGIYDSDTKWEMTDGGSASVSNGTLTISSNGVRVDAKTKINNRNAVLCFQMKLDDLGTTDGDYQGFDIKLNDAGAGYLVVFKKEIIEWQRIGKTLTVIPNDFIEAGKWYNVEAGGINTPNGVLQFLRIDGRIIYAELDQTANQTKDEGNFRIRKNALGNISVKNMENVSPNGIIIDDLLNNFNNPASVSHLETLFIGASDAIEMSSSELFMSVDKSKLAQLVYPEVTKGNITVSRNDITAYKQLVYEMSIVQGYNDGLKNILFRNNVDFQYNDVLNVESIDQNGVTIFSFYDTMPDSYKSIAVDNMLGKNCQNIDELRMCIAKAIFTTVINASRTGFAAQSEYITNVLTKENADYLGIDISDYLALPIEKKELVNNAVGVLYQSDTRTFDELIEDIHKSVEEFK